MKARGFTLIELMISMALFGLIAAGAMTLVLSGTRMQTHSARVDVAQSSLRAAVDFITRDVLAASAGVSSGQITNYLGQPVTAVNFATAPNSTTAPDVLELYTVDGTTAAQLTSPVGPGALTLPIGYESVQSGASRQFLAQPPLLYPAYVQVSDLSTAAIAPLQTVTATTLILTGAGLRVGYGAYSYVLPSRHVTYKISTTTFGAAATGNASMLMMDVNGSGFQPLAEGVEDMQIAYGFDTTNSGVVREVGVAANDDDWLYNVAGDTIQAQMVIGNLRTIRVTIIVKGTSVEGGQQNLPARPAAEDRTAGGVDGFIRRVLRTEIAVRNFNE